MEQVVTDEVLASDPPGVEDSVLTERPASVTGPESEETLLRRNVRAAVIASEVGDTPFVGNFTRFADKADPVNRQISGKQRVDQQADALRADRTQRVLDLYVQQEQAPELVGDALTRIQEEDAVESSDPAKGTKEYVRAMADPTTDAAVIRDLEVRLELLDQVSTIAEDISGWETAGDVLLEIALAPKVLIDNFQLTGEFFGDQETVQRTLGWFRGLPPDQKEEFFPMMRDMALEAMPRGKAVAFMAALLDPTAEEAVTDEFGIWSLVDTAAIAAGVLSVGLRLRKALNPLKAAAKAGDYERAADMNLAILQAKDEELGELLDVPRLTAMDNAAPFKSDDYNDAADATISPATHERIFKFRDKMKEVFGSINEGRSFARESMVDDMDRPSAIKRIDREFETYIADRFQGKDKPVNFTSVKSDDSRGVSFEFEVTTPDGRIIKDTYRGIFVEDDIGFYQNLPGGGFFASEKTQVAKTDLFSLVQAALRLDLTSAAVGQQLRNLAKEASKPIRKIKGNPLSRKQRIKEVDHVLISGDDLQKEFTVQELKSGVNGIKLDDDQIEYYYNMRTTMNGLAVLRNMDTRAFMEARGVKEIKVGSAQTFGEPMDFEKAQRRLNGSRGPIKSVFKQDANAGGPVEVSKLNLKEEYDRGFRLIRLEEDSIFQGRRYQHILVKTDDIGELPAMVVDIKKGYIPRVNPNALYFVQAFTPSTLDGIGDLTRKAVRSFDNRAEAEAFAKSFDEGKVAEGFSQDTIIRVVDDGELEALKAGDSGLGGAHGLFHSPRARNKVPHNDGDASDVPRTSALESIELYLENSKNFLSRNEWRMGSQRKWENTARQMLPGNKDITFENPGAALANDKLAIAHKKISEFSGFMDKSERTWERMVKGAHEWALPKVGRGKISDFIISNRQTDPLAAMRSITFNTLLGFFNPIQLWVQAQGAAVAIGINMTNPVRFQKVFRGQSGLALMQHEMGKLTPAMRSKLAKSTGFKDEAELIATKELWDKTGLYDSTLSSADVEAAARGFPTTGGALKSFADSGLMFFRAGELFNRRTAFLTALDEAGGAAKVAGSDVALKAVMDRTNDLILNLGKANRAQWQKGILSVPTQFLQIQAKTIESVLGLNGAFTPMERAKLLTAQLGLYGSVGVFGGNWVMRNMMSAAGIDQTDLDSMDPATVRAISGGFTDWFAYQMGADITAADRGALLNGMDQTVLSFFTEETTLFNWLGGPSSVAPTRLWQAMREISPWFATPQDMNGETELTAQEISDGLRRMTSDVSDILTSPFAVTSQYNKFRLMQDLGILRDKNGNLVAAPSGGFNWQTEWAALVGFKPELLQKKFDISEINQEEIDYVRFRTSVLLKQWDEFLMAYNRAQTSGKPMTEEDMQKHRVDYLVGVDSLQPHVRKKVMDSFRRRLRERRAGNSQLDRQQQKFYDNMVIRMTDAWFDDVRGRSTTSDDTRIIQVDPVFQPEETE